MAAATKTNMKAGWFQVHVGQIYQWNGRLARVSGKFPTTEGTFVSLRDPETGASLGNCPHGDLGEKAQGRSVA